jgi:sulfite exporter TauE/SafE
MLFTDSLYLVFFTTGLTVGFGHCIGMCGPIVVSFSLHLKRRPTTTPHLLYHAGRICTYTLLGGIMGITGSFTGVISNIAGIQKGVMIFAGFLVILMGLAMTGWVPLGHIFRNDSPQGWITKIFRRLSTFKSPLVYFPMGLLLGLLPCGPVYTALVAAAGAGVEAKGPWQGFVAGMGLMLVFGFGTVPALLLVAKLASLGWLKSREVIFKIGAFLMILVGVYFVYKGIQY